MVTYVYKIRNSEGFFSIGTTKPKFTENGKYWSNLKFLRSHLSIIAKQTPKDHPDYPYHGCSIVRFKIEEDEVLENIK